MATSKTKYEATDTEIKELFLAHRIGNVSKITPLGDGEFNAAYKATCDDGTSYVLKIAPPDDSKVLSYEKGMMESEVFWYKMMHEKTDILCPKVYVSDFSETILHSSCFIMELMEGEPLWAVNFTESENKQIQTKKIEMLTKIHRISNDKFGYRQAGLHDTWYLALRSMAENLVKDCKALGKETPDGEKFISYIDKHRKILEKVSCRMVNFDLWDSNILYNPKTAQICWIDPERGFWGDPVADFITLGSGQKTLLSQKQNELDIYNEMTKEKIQLTEENEIRYALLVCYLALIEEVEKYVRYETDHPNYIRNTADAREMYDIAFKVL